MYRDLLRAAFEKYVQRAEGCWNWQASVGNHGYGQLTFLQRKYTAHRLSWELNVGPVPDGLCVLHRCDNRRCTNPGHLFLGTRRDNLLDMTEKGRRVKGARHGRAKLTEEQVLHVLRSDQTGVKLAAELNVSKSAISLIRRRHNWKHLEH